MINVQCEACHGYMFKHIHNIKKNNPPENRANRTAGDRDQIRQDKSIDISVCIKCHDKERDPDFNFDEDRKKIIH